MTEYRMQRHETLKRDMMEVARGEKPARKDAAMPSFNSIQALTNSDSDLSVPQ